MLLTILSEYILRGWSCKPGDEPSGASDDFGLLPHDSPTLQPGPFTKDVLKVTVRDVVGASDVPKSATRLMVHLQLARSTREDLPVQDVVLEASRSPIGTTRWTMQCPGCHSRRRSLYLVGASLFCARCCGLKYSTQTLSSARRRSELFGRQRAALEARPGRRSRRWGWLVVQEREEALRLLN